MPQGLNAVPPINRFPAKLPFYGNYTATTRVGIPSSPTLTWSLAPLALLCPHPRRASSPIPSIVPSTALNSQPMSIPASTFLTRVRAALILPALTCPDLPVSVTSELASRSVLTGGTTRCHHPPAPALFIFITIVLGNANTTISPTWKTHGKPNLVVTTLRGAVWTRRRRGRERWPFIFNVPTASRRTPRKVDHKIMPMGEDLNHSPANDRHPRTVTLALALAPNTTHLLMNMLAVFHRYSAPTPPSGQPCPRKVTLYPMHSLVLATNCATITTSPSPNTVPQEVLKSSTGRTTIPSGRLPCRIRTRTHTTSSRRTSTPRRRALPAPGLAQKSLDDTTGKLAMIFANTLAQTFMSVALAKNIVSLHGLWANAFALDVVGKMFFGAIWVRWM
ncbi:hypothetical protein D9619_002378 [Psilocybe cf. subviscida]|uniref:Uncharacterized protein n=1 Tax=Psilocybe cf. subviscida TaxID=2480587 RepID=A0A8H5AY78_9AGAR|nr:hypothetical protein D9619_002378 [Psilocybe cf. subviscida]